ncbi:MAG TPA: type VI secretion system protein IglI family protein [Polyangia bacterium]|nr:type VI secretion system protein IglI family protein [Polyangia bacterium]
MKPAKPVKIDLGLLDRALPVAEYPGLESSEPRLLEIYRLADQGEDLPAGEKAQALLKTGFYDVRLLGFFFFGAFVEQGPPCLPDLGGTLLRTVGENWAAFGPVYKRERLYDGALGRLFRSIRERLAFHKQFRDARWNDWIQATTPMILSMFRTSAERLQAVISEHITNASSTDELLHLEAWLKDELLPLLVAFHAPPASPPEEPADHPSPPAESEPSPPGSPSAELLQQGYSLSPPGYITIALSPALARLIDKLQGFADLVEAGKLNRAAIVADDIRQTLESFDPRLHLPKLLSSYFRLLAAHVDELAPHWQDRGTPAWQMLEQFYLVDFDAFIKE